MKPFKYQANAVHALIQYFEEKSGNPLIVAPTASGKSVMIAEFCKHVLTTWPGQRILMLTHVKELVEQNHARLTQVWPDAPVGIYAAGLKRRDLGQPIVFASVQSLARAKTIPHFDLIIVDEAHRVPPMNRKSQYRYIFDALPKAKVIGLTATPYRGDYQPLAGTEAWQLFTDVAYEISVDELLEIGRVSLLRPFGSKTGVDLAQVKIKNGEFDLAKMSDLYRAVGREIVGEVVHRARLANRCRWMVFCCDIEHCDDTASLLEEMGVSHRIVTGKTPDAERAQIVREFRDGRFTALVNCAVFTTGFDVPSVDLIVMLRATQSPVLYVQIMGRGMRVAPHKEDCLVLDYGTNAERHGPINTIKPRTRAPGKAETAMKKCPICDGLMLPGITICPHCGHEFERERENPFARLETTASTAQFVQRPRWVDVKKVVTRKHVKRDTGAESLRVDYHCGLQIHSVWVAIGREGFAGRKAAQWWREHGTGDVPAAVSQALARPVRTPARIKVMPEGRFTKIQDYDYEPCSKSPIAGRSGCHTRDHALQ